MAAAAAAAAGLGIRNGNTGAGINPLGGGANMNLIGNPGNIFNSNPVGQVNKMRHSSSEKAASNRSKLLEDFRYVVRLQEYHIHYVPYRINEISAEKQLVLTIHF